MNLTNHRRIPEQPVPGKPLGRHVNHDPRSRLFRVGQAPVITSRDWTSEVGVFNQGRLGSCVGNATVGELATDPFYRTLSDAQRGEVNEDLAVKVYSMATHFDPYAGQYPPTDTGSDGLSAAKAAVRLGYASGYIHALSLADVQSMLQSGPCAVGVNWYSSFDRPVNGLITIASNAYVRGGHELCVTALVVEERKVRLRNSWGPDWGASGSCWIGFDDLDRLLHEDGDATQLVSLTAPRPTPAPTSDADHVLIAAAEIWRQAKGYLTSEEGVSEPR